MADKDNGAGKSGHHFLKQIKRLHVEIVGWFIQDEQIGRTGQDACEDQTCPFTS